MRVPVGGYLKGGAVYHSQSGVSTVHADSRACASFILQTRSMRTASCAQRFAATIRCLFLEHKHLYRQAYNKSQYPGDDFMIPFGKAKTVREGTDLSIITYGALVQRSNRPRNRPNSRASASRSSTCARCSLTTGKRSPRR